MRRSVLILFSLALLLNATVVSAQQKRFDQDPSLDNLVHVPGTKTCALNSLGRVTKVGSGPRSMILIAGAGFGDGIFEELMSSWTDEFSMYVVTLPGFGATAPPPMPPAGTSYGEQSWTTSAVNGVAQLIDDNELEQPVLVAHWFTAPQVALRLALERPDDIGAVVVISGIATYDGGLLPPGTKLSRRIAYVDKTLAPGWFRTVTRDTWDDNNFYPSDYARNPILALQLWRQAAEPALAIWIRYLCEGWAQDITQDLPTLKVPTLLLLPGFDEDFVDVGGQKYMQAFCRNSWDGVADANDHISQQVIEDSRVFMMDDQPEALDRAIRGFLEERDLIDDSGKPANDSSSTQPKGSQ